MIPCAIVAMHIVDRRFATSTHTLPPHPHPASQPNPLLPRRYFEATTPGTLVGVTNSFDSSFTGRCLASRSAPGGEVLQIYDVIGAESRGSSKDAHRKFVVHAHEMKLSGLPGVPVADQKYYRSEDADELKFKATDTEDRDAWVNALTPA